MAGIKLGQAQSGKWNIFLVNNDSKAPEGLVIPMTLKYLGGNEVEMNVRKGTSTSAETNWSTEIGVDIDTEQITFTGTTTSGGKTYVVTDIDWTVVAAKYIRVSPESLTIASGAGSTGRFTIETNVTNLDVTVSPSDNFSVDWSGNIATVAAKYDNTGQTVNHAIVIVSDLDGKAKSVQVSVEQDAGGSPTPTEVEVTVHGTLEQTDSSVPGETYNEMVILSDTDSVLRNEPTEVKAIYTTYKTQPISYGSRRGVMLGAALGDVAIKEEDVTDKCIWESSGYVSISSDGKVTNENRKKSKETATITASYNGASAQKSLELEAGIDDGEVWTVKITPETQVEIANGESEELRFMERCYKDGASIYEDDITRDSWTTWSILSGKEYATVLYGEVTNINTDEFDREVEVQASHKSSGTDTKMITMKGTGSHAKRLHISAISGEPIPRMGGSMKLYIDSNLSSWNISVEAISGDTDPSWFDVGFATGSGQETRTVTAGTWTTQYNKKCRKVRVTVTGDGVEPSSVIVTQLCSVNASLSPASFPGPEGGVAKLTLSPGGDITSTWRLYMTNGATGVSFTEVYEPGHEVREITGTCVDGNPSSVNVYISSANTWNSTRCITFEANFETISTKKSGSVNQLRAKLKLMNSSDAEAMENIAYNDDTTYELAIDSNVTWEVVEPQEEWIHASKNGDSLELSFGNNDGGERAGTVQLRAVANHDKTYEINIRQNGQ